MARIALVKCEKTYYTVGITPPLGIMYLAAVLRQKGHTVKLFDARFNPSRPKKVMDEVVEFRPDWIGLSSLTIEARSLHSLSAEAKERLKGGHHHPDKSGQAWSGHHHWNCKIVAGGPHATAYPEDCLRDKNIDFVVRHEGEQTFPELIEMVENKGDLEGVKGIGFRRNKELFFTEQRPFIEDLDSLPFPAWDLVDIYRYGKHFHQNGALGRYMPLFTSRACPYKCIYCHSIFGKGFRARSPANVIAEIETLYKDYGIKDFDIIDDIFNFDTERVKLICDKIVESGMHIRLSFPNGLRGDRLGEDVLIKMKEAGTCFLVIAIETASPRLQKLIKKNLDLERAKEAIEVSRRLKIFTRAFFMLGFPTETREEILETINFAVKSKLHSATFFAVQPFERTELYSMCKEKLHKNNFADYEYFRPINLSEVNARELGRIMGRAGIRFNTPIRILHNLVGFPSKRGLMFRINLFLRHAMRE